MPAIAKTRRIDDDVLAVLGSTLCTENSVAITTGNLDRKLYTKVNEVLEALGGKWNRKLKVHVFESGDPQELMETAILTGGYTKPGDMGWFPTPIEVVKQMLQYTDIKGTMRVLEPSAGMGAIANELLVYLPSSQIDVVELDPARADTLEGKYNTLIRGDFLQVAPEQKYDRVFMNPPFAPRQADIDHVLHAYKFLKPNGWLLSIMASSVKFRDNSKTTEFRKFLAEKGGAINELPENSFKQSGTSVNTVLVAIPS